MRRLVVLPALLLALSACSDDADGADDPADDTGPKTFEVAGTLQLTTYDGVNYADIGAAGEECWGEQGYDDIAAGAQVVVRDSKGEQVGLGQLLPGALPEDFEGSYTCEFPFTVKDIPESSGLFTVEVGNRGEVTFEREQADAVVLTLG